MTDWTRDENGGFVDWTKPPFYVNGILTLLLPGEAHADPDTLSKRRHEYMKLQRRRLRSCADSA